jgi:hypothetical protein
MNQKYLYMRYLNLFFKSPAVLLVTLLLIAPGVFGITLNGVYFGTCERDIGVIINVDESRIQLLTLKGRIKNISRFDIIYLAEYPLGNIPISSIQNADARPINIINTQIDFESRELVRGWPIDFSDQSILFLTTDGDEMVISRDDIHSVETAEEIKRVDLKNATKAEFTYHYPALFNHCQAEKTPLTGETALNDVYPQQLIGNALLIKSSLDHLMAEYERMGDYNRDQKFYAVPRIYTNDTHIGLWYNLNSRHGASDSRNNSIIPYIISDLSEGPFGFQRRVTTGVWLMPYSVHEEPQSLFSYALKADYFHFSVMFDPSMILVGPNYQWKKKELETHDDRINESFHLAAGFDIGGFALEIALPFYQIGVRNDEFFANDGTGMFRYGLFYKNQYFETSFYYGQGSRSDKNEKEEDSKSDTAQDEASTYGSIRNELVTTRLNFAVDCFEKFRPFFSLIYRGYGFHREADEDDYGAFDYQSKTVTVFITLDYRFENDITLSGYASLESNNREFDSDEYGPGTDKKQYVKSGGSIMLTF